jgi:integrase
MLCKVKGSPYQYTNFTAPNGERVRVSTKTTNKTLARKYTNDLYEKYWRKVQLGEQDPKTWQEAVVSWSITKKEKKSWVDIQRHLRILDPYFSGLLQDVKPETFDKLISDLMALGRANGTINRSLEVAKAVFIHCKKRGWVQQVPDIVMLDEPTAKIRFLTKIEAEKLISELPYHLAEMCRFSLCTGLRDSNVTGLQWDRVDLERKLMWIEGYELKNGEPFGVPLNNEAVEVLKRQLGKHPEWVFVYAGSRVGQGNTKAFRKALRRAGIDNFRWHDLRHTWASWHVQKVPPTPLPVLQILGGWKSYEMVLRYAHLGESHYAEYA